MSAVLLGKVVDGAACSAALCGLQGSPRAASDCCVHRETSKFGTCAPARTSIHHMDPTFAIAIPT
eukprot:4570047-Pleurochrysis_carterae.AAC.2